MASTSVVFDILAKDRASDKFDHLGKSIGGSSSKLSAFTGVMKNAGKVAILGLGAGLVLGSAALVGMTKNAVEDEAAQRKLALALQNSVGATDEQVASVESWISKMGVATGIADDEMRPALQRLVESTGSITEAQRQMEIAFDVSAGTGKSLKTVTEALMKANNGTTASLSKLGLKTKDAEGNALSLDDALKKMSQTFGGQAAAKAGTLQGKMDRLKLIFDETKETIGSKLIPVVSDLADFFLNKVVPAADDVVGAVKPIASLAFGKLKDAAGDIKDFFQSAKGHAAVATSMGAMAVAAGLIKAGWQKASTAIGDAKSALEGIDFGNLDSEEIGTLLGDAVRVGLTKVAQMGGDLAAALGVMFGKVDWVGLGIAMGEQVPALLVGLATGLIHFDMSGLFQQMGDHWWQILAAVLAVAFGPVKFAGLIGKILGKIPFVGKFLERATIWLNEAGGKFLGMLGRFFGRVWTRVVAEVKFPGAGLVSKIVGAIKGLPAALGRFFGDLGARISLYAEAAFGWLEKGAARAIISTLHFLGRLPGRILGAIGNLARLLFPKGTAVIEGLWNGAKGKIGEVLGWAKALPGRVVSAVGDLGGILLGAGRALLQGLYDGILEKWHDVQNLVGGMASWIKSHKGPLEADRVLLKPAGEAIMAGLIDGIESKKGELADVLLKMGKTIAGVVKNAWPDFLAGLMRDQLEGARSSLASFREGRNEFADFSGFRGNLFGADISGAAGATTTRDAEGNDITISGPTGLAALRAFAAAERMKADQLAADVSKLTGMGISQDLLEDLKSQGASGLEQIHALASASQAEANEIFANMAAANADYQKTGNDAASRLDERLAQMGAAVSGIAREMTQLVGAPPVVNIQVDLTGRTVVQTVKAEERATGRTYWYPVHI